MASMARDLELSDLVN